MKMKLKLNKKKIKSLSNDNKAIPADMTPQVAGGVTSRPCGPMTHDYQYTCGIGHTCPQVY
jgi:hypothetical protein